MSHPSVTHKSDDNSKRYTYRDTSNLYPKIEVSRPSVPHGTRQWLTEAATAENDGGLAMKVTDRDDARAAIAILAELYPNALRLTDQGLL